MALSARLEIRQGQSLVITPQLQQAIKLLQLSNLELESFIDGELEKNPLLDREDREGPTDGEREAPPAADADAEAARQAELERIRAAADAKKGAIKERKALTKAEQKAKKDARMQAYASLRPRSEAVE